MTNENAINVLRYLSPPRTSKADFDAFRQAIDMAIEALSQPEPHWIPCSERLPEKLDYYLISGIDSVWFAQYENGRFLGILSGHALDNVIAWMPLPEPFKEVTE